MSGLSGHLLKIFRLATLAQEDKLMSVPVILHQEDLHEVIQVAVKHTLGV